MPDKLLNNIIPAFISIVGLVIVLIGVSYLYKSIIIEREGVSRVGTVNNVELLSNTDFEGLSFEIKFEYDSVNYFIYNKVHDTQPIYKIGDKLTVKFIPGFPEEAIIDSQKEKYDGWVYMLLVGLAITSMWPAIQYLKWLKN